MAGAYVPVPGMVKQFTVIRRNNRQAGKRSPKKVFSKGCSMELNGPVSSDEAAGEHEQTPPEHGSVGVTCQSAALSAPDGQKMIGPSPRPMSASAAVEQQRHASLSPPSGAWPPLWRWCSTFLLLCLVAFHALSLGAWQFIGPQGWAYVLGGPQRSANANLLANINHRLRLAVTEKTAATARKAPISPLQYINLIIRGMTLDQKLGQMMIVQFLGATYSQPLS